MAGSIAAKNSAAFSELLAQREAQRDREQQRRGDRFGQVRERGANARQASASQRGASGFVARSARIRLANSSAVNNSSGISEKLNTTVTGLNAAISSKTYRSRRLNPYSRSRNHSAARNSGNSSQAKSVASGRFAGKLRIEFPNGGQKRGIKRRIFGLIGLAGQALDAISIARGQAARRDPIDAVVVIEAQVRHGAQRPGQVRRRDQRGQEHTDNGQLPKGEHPS